MIVVLIFAALFGGALTIAVLPVGILTALAAAPFGGSAVVMLAALILYERETRYGIHARRNAGQVRPSS
jgi:hypothetical protein